MTDVGTHTVAPSGADTADTAAPPPYALARLADWGAGLGLQDVPERVVELAKSQILSQLGSILAGARHPLGRRLIDAFGPPLQADARQGACVLAGLGSWLNLDDTAYAGHLSNSTVSVPVAFAHARGLDGRGLLTAVIAATECAARVTAAATLGPLRGHSALHAHLVGAAAGRLACDGAGAAQWRDALGLALGIPPWPLLRAFLASDSRVFNTFTPTRTAMDACDAAAAGFAGAADLLEHPDGFLATYAQVPLPEAAAAGLGSRWHTETLSFKTHPGGPGVDAAIDCAAQLHAELAEALTGRPDGCWDAADIDEVVVEASVYTVSVGRRVAAYVEGPDAPLGALVLSVPYPVATALLTGGLSVADFAPERVADPARRALAAKVRLVHAPEMTLRLFAGDAPFGEAVRQAGAAGGAWVRGFLGAELAGLAEQIARQAERDGPRGDFAESVKATPARVGVRLAGDGRVLTCERSIPHGAAGPELRAHHGELIRGKFAALGGDARVAHAARELDRMDAGALRAWIGAALRPAERAAER